MRKYLCLCLACVASFPAFAADDGAYVSLFEGTSAAETSKKNDSDDENSIFSFLNFKSKKKEPAVLNVADEKRLSPVEQAAKLAEKGDVNAQLTLGYLYLYGGEGVSVDYDKAFEYYAQAAMQNDNVGLNNLGSLYYSGIGIERNPAKAAVLFEKAAKLGNVEAAVNLGFMKLTGNGVVPNPREAMALFEQAAAQKNPTASFMIGYARYSGNLLERDYRKAAEEIRLAADAKFVEAQYYLALMYINGLGMPQNYGNAVKYLKLAVSQGHIDAMMTLGDIWERGEKFTKDLYWAHIMFNLAAVRGASGAAQRRDALEGRLKIDELLQAQAEAEKFHEKPSELTSYIQQTFGTNVHGFIDNAR